MTSATDDLRWSFTVPTPLGDTHSTYEVRADALRYESDDSLGGGSDVLRWDSIKEGATAAMAGMGGRGGPDMARWVPAELEWLTLSRSDGGKPFMRVLPRGHDRDAIVAAVRSRLGARWIGERLPLKDAQARLGMASSEWSKLKVWGLVVAALATLAGLLVLLSLLVHPVISVPAGFLLGGWVFRDGLQGLRDGIAAANTPTAKASSAALGFVELQGRAVTEHSSPAGVTGRPSVWWDVAIHVWSEDNRGNGEWRPFAARYGGAVDVVDLEDETGRVPVWLRDAALLLDSRTWESGHDVLPRPGAALLQEIGLPWSDGRRVSVTETCLEANGSLYVLGTLDERRNVPAASDASRIDRVSRMLRSGEWRRELVAAMPGPFRIVVAVVIGYLDIVTKVGVGGERARRVDATEPPSIAPAALLIWKGRSGRPFLVSNRPEPAALALLRRRSLMVTGIGAAILCFTLYQLVDIFAGS